MKHFCLRTYCGKGGWCAKMSDVVSFSEQHPVWCRGSGLVLNQFCCHQPARVGTLQAGLVPSKHKEHLQDYLRKSLNPFKKQCQTQ